MSIVVSRIEWPHNLAGVLEFLEFPEVPIKRAGTENNEAGKSDTYGKKNREKQENKEKERNKQVKSKEKDKETKLI